MAVSVGTVTTNLWPGAYPFNETFSAVCDAGATALLAFVTSSTNGASWSPTATWGAQAMTLIASKTVTAGQGCVWVFGLIAPTAGTQTFTVGIDNQYADIGAAAVVPLLGTDTSAPFEASSAVVGGGTSVGSLVTTSAGDLIVSAGSNHYTTGTPGNTGSATITAAWSATTAVNHQQYGYTMPAATAGTYTETFTTTNYAPGNTNPTPFAMVAVKAAATGGGGGGITGAGTVATRKATLSSAAAFTAAPVTIAATIRSVKPSIVSAGTFVAPGITAVAAVASRKATVASTGTAAPATVTGAATAATRKATLTSAASFAPASVSAVGVTASKKSVAAVAATFVPAPVTIAAALPTRKATVASTVVFTPVGTVSAGGTVATRKATAVSAASFSLASVTAAAALSTRKSTLAASAGQTFASITASALLSTRKATLSALVAYQRQGAVSSVGSVRTSKALASASGTHVAPIIPYPTAAATYQCVTQGAFLTALSVRLGDPANRFWSAAELRLYMAESLRTWQAYTSWYRTRATLNAEALGSWYDLAESLTPSVMGYNVTDQYLTSVALYHLIEPQLSGGTWIGTDQFSIPQIQQALQHRLNRFLGDTGLVVYYGLQSIGAAQNGRVKLPTGTIDVMRTAYVDSTSNLFSVLWRSNEWEMNSFRHNWAQVAATPQVWSRSVTQPEWMQLSPPPLNPGQLELLTISPGPKVNLSAGAPGITLRLPDDFTWGVKWGALADLLGADGQAKDPLRAQYCEMRYQECVQVARSFPAVMQMYINNIPVFIGSIYEMDSFAAGWENELPSAPVLFGMAGRNLLAMSPAPTADMNLTVDVVANIPIPATDADCLVVPPDIVPTLLDYAQHLAAFKMGGSEFMNTMPQRNNLLYEASNYNQRLRQLNFFNDAVRSISSVQFSEQPRLETPLTISYQPPPPQTPNG